MEDTYSILWVTRRFYPHGDASSQVIGHLLQPFAQLGYQSDILALTAYPEDAGTHDWEGAKVHQVYVPGSADRALWQGELRKHPLRAVCMLTQKVVSKLALRFQPAWKVLSIEPVLLHAYQKALRQLTAEKRYGAVIATLWPMEAVEAMLLEIKTIPRYVYQLDTYQDNSCFPSEYRPQRKQKEERVVESVDKLFTTPLVYRDFVAARPDLQDCLVPLRFPLLCQKEAPAAPKTPGEKTHCVFLGTLYPQLRPVEDVVRIIAQAQDMDAIFDFYGSGQELVRCAPYYKQAEKQIVCHGSVSSKAAEQQMQQADVLVNIDNTVLNQLPSKIYDYMSTGKPILNLYFHDASATLEVLGRYPHCLNVKVGCDADEKRIPAFIKENIGQQVAFETLAKVYEDCTPAWVAEKMAAHMGGGERLRKS